MIGRKIARVFSLFVVSWLLCSLVLILWETREVQASPGIGYWIIAAGTYYGGLQSEIDYGCNEAFRILLRLGYSKDRIYYLNPSFQDIDDDGNDDRDNWSSGGNLEYAIKTWASGKVSVTESLFLYLFDHGGLEVFCIENTTGYFSVASSDLASWLSSLPSNVPKHVIYAACHSGSFINELSSSGRIVISTCREDESSYLGPGVGARRWEAFSKPFWRKVQSGNRILRAFNYACQKARTHTANMQTPLLDDDGNGVGNTCPLPNNNDGYVASGVRIGSSWSWVFPYVRYLISVITIQWPPTSSVPLWARIVNATPLDHVRVWMQPPGWSPPSGNNMIVPLGLAFFEMTDPDNDGNFTVDIPPSAFISGMGLYRFIVTAEETDYDTAISLSTGIQFTSTGDPPSDTTNPTAFIERPFEERLVSGTVSIKGFAEDDVCLDYVELHINGDHKQTVNLSPTSNSYFEFTFDTTTVSDGLTTITVKAYDATGNSDTDAVEVIIENETVGGNAFVIDKFSLLAPRILVALVVVTTTIVVYVKLFKHRKENQ